MRQKWYPQAELNGHQRFRKPPLYPFELWGHTIDSQSLTLNSTTTFTLPLCVFRDLSYIWRHEAQSQTPETVKVGNVVVKIYRRDKQFNGKTYSAFEVGRLRPN